MWQPNVLPKTKTMASKKNVIVASIIAVVLVPCIVIGVIASGGGYTSNERCNSCGGSSAPTRRIVADNGIPRHYCEKCVTTCTRFCSEKATKYFTNLTGYQTFMCEKHYAEWLRGR